MMSATESMMSATEMLLSGNPKTKARKALRLLKETSRDLEGDNEHHANNYIAIAMANLRLALDELDDAYGDEGGWLF